MDDLNQLPLAVRARDAGKIATTNVTNELVAALQSVGIADGHGPARGPRSLLLKLGTPHGSLTGVFTDNGPIELAPKWDLDSTTAGVFAVTDDEQMPREDTPDGTLTIDVAELVDTHLGYFANHNNGPEATDGRDVYLVDRSGVFPFLITDNGPLGTGTNRWRYYGKRVRMTAFPGAVATGWPDVFEIHPDAPATAVDMLNLAELDNSALVAAGMTIDANFTGLGPVSGIVFARAVSYPKVGSTPGGVVWFFTKENAPIVPCAVA